MRPKSPSSAVVTTLAILSATSATARVVMCLKANVYAVFSVIVMFFSLVTSWTIALVLLGISLWKGLPPSAAAVEAQPQPQQPQQPIAATPAAAAALEETSVTERSALSQPLGFGGALYPAPAEDVRRQSVIPAELTMHPVDRFVMEVHRVLGCKL